MTCECNSCLPTIGYIGLGDMGLPIVKNLLAAGYKVQGFDLDEEKLKECIKAGGSISENIEELVKKNEIILTTLPSSESFISVAEKELIPNAIKGQIFIELGTTIPFEVRRLAKLFSEKEATLLDVPVSGGKVGAERANLKMFAAGSREIFELCLPVLKVIGGQDKIFYCGNSGDGQVMKGINQLQMALMSASCLELMAFGVREGLDAKLIKEVFEDSNPQRLPVVARTIDSGEGNNIGVKFRELMYYIKEVQEQNYSLPMTEALYNFCKDGDRVVVDDHRLAPSYWHELLIQK